MTLSGANGTITLALALSIPNSIKMRLPIIFVAGSVVIISLIVPVISLKFVMQKYQVTKVTALISISSL
ncbi:NhaP-type Na+/H+ or K+/H+ antiporter [Weissella beninensis]|uniref:PIN-like protein n=1 Tax=Periweissella beninensis TaxID=504936 RepID=A0ABT0VIJ8_9LACO|nr:hypothetical protein [Periweissella beninensis]MBM7544978.1 NhaP-type Na+/H+ or K+/H+ antiporter [Periweissella beninensis]MCM2437224.1 hypothetical protein [Periweissella beninensis]